MTPKEYLELAQELQHSNVSEVSKLARAYLDLQVNYDELKHAYTMQSAEIVMKRHANLLKRLADSGD